MFMCVVTLQPFEYNVNEKYTHKFMVQSIIIPENATQQDIDNMVCIMFLIYHHFGLVLCLYF